MDFSAMQRGQVGDITAGFSLGPWTEELLKDSWRKMRSIGTRRGLRVSGVNAGGVSAPIVTVRISKQPESLLPVQCGLSVHRVVFRSERPGGS